MDLLTVNNVTVNGVNIFYREAGAQDAPVILLLHGFPSSSFMFRHLVPLLAVSYRVIAPDLPGFGFTEVPAGLQYQYTFQNLAETTGSFLDILGIKRFAVYIFDYGAPTGLRLALNRPDSVSAIISQNGNAYVEGMADREALLPVLTYNTTKSQYVDGSPHPNKIEPETYHLDQALMDRPGNKNIQLDLFYDYRTNVDLYPKFQGYFRDSAVPVLAIWGKNDEVFIPPGAEAFKRDVKHLELHFLDAGHFALETNEVEVAKRIDLFLKKNEVA